LKAVETGLGRQRPAEESKTLARSDKDGAAPASHMPGCDCRRARLREAIRRFSLFPGLALFMPPAADHQDHPRT
jgi:hypothetical protein